MRAHSVPRILDSDCQVTSEQIGTFLVAQIINMTTRAPSCGSCMPCRVSIFESLMVGTPDPYGGGNKGEGRRGGGGGGILSNVGFAKMDKIDHMNMPVGSNPLKSCSCFAGHDVEGGCSPVINFLCQVSSSAIRAISHRKHRGTSQSPSNQCCRTCSLHSTA